MYLFEALRFYLANPAGKSSPRAVRVAPAAPQLTYRSPHRLRAAKCPHLLLCRLEGGSKDKVSTFHTGLCLRFV